MYHRCCTLRGLPDTTSRSVCVSQEVFLGPTRHHCSHPYSIFYVASKPTMDATRELRPKARYGRLPFDLYVLVRLYLFHPARILGPTHLLTRNRSNGTPRCLKTVLLSGHGLLASSSNLEPRAERYNILLTKPIRQVTCAFWIGTSLMAFLHAGLSSGRQRYIRF